MRGTPDSIGPYTVEREIGRGGMGVVYLGRDTRLGRSVAIKALPEDLAKDPDRLSRFEREARTLASLNHPSIAGIYGVEESGGARYLVLEYVEGESLDAVLKRGPLPVREAVRTAVAVARALEAAHEKGIVHRDLKPGNIVLTPDGEPKVLDFGLARQAEGSASGTSFGADSPTLTSPVAINSPTIPGVILGTAGYMSPEQARGRAVDKRSDIFSFGCVLYEMLTGARPFAGETLADVMGATLHKDLDLSLLPPGTPASVRRVLARCLVKDRRERLHDIADARIDLESPQADESSGSAASSGRRSIASLAGWAIAALAVVGAALVAWRGSEPGAAPAAVVVNAEIPLPEGVQLALSGSAPGVPQASPDGRWMAFTGVGGSGGAEHLYLTDLASGVTRRVEGTRGARYPFWSPDSRSIGYFASGQLMRVEVAGGPPRSLADAGNGKGGAWLDDGRIVYSPTPGSTLRIIPAGGGESAEFSKFGEVNGLPDNSHRHPFSIPGTDRLLFLKRTELGLRAGSTSAIYIRSLDGSVEEFVVNASGNAQYADGRLFYTVGSTLVARPYDPMTNRFMGEPAPVMDGVLLLDVAQLGMYSVSRSGVLTCVKAASGLRTFDLISWDRSSGERRVIESEGPYAQMSLFDGDRKMLLRVDFQESAGRSIFVRDMTTGRTQPIEVVLSAPSLPEVSRDGTRMAYGSRHVTAEGAVYLRAVAPFAEATPIYSSGAGLVTVESWTDGDRALLVTGWAESGPDRRGGMGLLRLEAEPKRVDPIETPLGAVYSASASPLGRWVSATAENASDPAIFLVDLEQPDRVVMVSTEAAVDPQWRGDGRELYYRTREAVCAVELQFSESGDLLSVGEPKEIVRAPALVGTINRTYSVTLDGKTVYCFQPTASQGRDAVTILTDWRASVGLER